MPSSVPGHNDRCCHLDPGGAAHLMGHCDASELKMAFLETGRRERNGKMRQRARRERGKRVEWHEGGLGERERGPWPHL